MHRALAAIVESRVRRNEAATPANPGTSTDQLDEDDMTTAANDEPLANPLAQELETLARETAASASRPVQTLIRTVLVAVLVATGGGGVWLYSTDEQIRAAASHEATQDAKIAANTKATESNGKDIRRIAVLLVQQGRYVEDMVRDVASGKPIRDRPPELDTIERQILASSDD